MLAEEVRQQATACARGGDRGDGASLTATTGTPPPAVFGHERVCGPAANKSPQSIDPLVCHHQRRPGIRLRRIALSSNPAERHKPNQAEEPG